MRPLHLILAITVSLAACAPSNATSSLRDQQATAVPVDAYPFQSQIRAAAAAHNVPPPLVAALVDCESSFNPGAVSHAGARGLMQIMPATAHFMGFRGRPRDLHDPRHNLNTGARYLRYLIDRHGSVWTALVAWNWGEGNLVRAGTRRLPAETVRLLKCVADRRGRYQSLS